MHLPINLKTTLIGIAVVAVSFLVSLKAMDWLSPRGTVRAPVLVQLPPLPPAPRSSSIIAPVAIALSAIRDAADRGAPRSFAGKADNPASQILQNADRLDRLARPDHHHGCPGCAVAGDAADRDPERDGLAFG